MCLMICRFGTRPSGRMYEGDLFVLLDMVKKLSNEVSEMRSKFAAIAHDVRASSSSSSNVCCQ